MSLTRVPRRRLRRAPVAVEVRSEPERVAFHFPVEIHMEEPGEPVDLDTVAEHVFTRLARRLS